MDINGRKPFLILPLIGLIITYAIWLVLSHINSLSPYYFLIASFPVSLSGGNVAILACSYSYVADTTTVMLRAVRMAILALFMGLGTMLGYLLTNEFYKTFKNNLPEAIYGTSICITLVNALYTSFIVPETIINEETESNIFKRFTTLFNTDHIKESIRVLFAKKPNHGRVLVLLLIFTIVLSVIIEQGEGAYLLLATRAALSWTSDDYNNFRSRMVLIGVCIGAPGLYILKRFLKVTDLFFLIIVIIMQLASSIITALAYNSLTFYIGRGLGIFIELIRAVSKTKISFLVLNVDIGKIFAIISTLEAIAPLIATPIYSAVYVKVLSYKPFHLFFLSVVLCSLILISLIAVKAIQWKYGIKEVRRR